MSKIKVNGKVLRVLDGDTIEVAVKVRFARIDAPEIHGIERPMGLVTEEWLKTRIDGKEIQLEITGGDVYRRILAEVYDGSVNINNEELDEKLAEVYAPEHHNNGKLDV